MAESRRKGFLRLKLGQAAPLTARLLLRLLLLVCVLDQVAEAVQADSVPRERNSLPPGTEDAKLWFLERYADASARLSADPSPLHGRVRYRQFQSSKPFDWRTIDIFIDDRRVRVQRDYGASVGGSNVKPPDAMLLTPETAATVVDPGTEFASATYLSDEPSELFSHEVWVHSWRLLRASYCIGEKPLSDHLANGDLILDSVAVDPIGDEFLHLRCRPRVDLIKKKADRIWRSQWMFGWIKGKVL